MAIPTRDELILLREQDGMTREDIAAHFDVSVGTVRRWIKEMDVPRPRRKKNYHKRSRGLSARGEIVGRTDDGVTVLEKAKAILGPRLTEKRGYGYFLDGRPVSVFKILDAAGLGEKSA